MKILFSLFITLSLTFLPLFADESTSELQKYEHIWKYPKYSKDEVDLMLGIIEASSCQKRNYALLYFTENSELKPIFKDSNVIKEALYRAIEKEILGQFKGEGECGADWACELFRIIAKLNEIKSIKYVLYHGCGDELKWLGTLGEEAVEPALSLFQGKKYDKAIPPRYKKFSEWKIDGLELLISITKTKGLKYPISIESKEKIKKSLISATKDQAPSIKLRALSGLSELVIQGDNDVLSIIEEIAKEDPYSQDFTNEPNYTGPKIRYPVREEAEKILEQLKKEGKIKE